MNNNAFVLLVAILTAASAIGWAVQCSDHAACRETCAVAGYADGRATEVLGKSRCACTTDPALLPRGATEGED